ncbi:MAG: type II secretion system F family protein [Verrucomicrobiota bacterium]|nr:MAG: type II secretion system F family protein [Verrucomicrobiota bacterium]
MKFSYKGTDGATGRTTSGTVEAADRKSAILSLQGRGIRVSAIAEDTGTTKSSFKFQLFQKSKSKIALSFLQKFLQLHGGGLPIGDAIRTMRKRLKDPQEQVLAETIHKDVCEGKTIAQAMRNFPDIFNENTVCMVEAGEKTGNLISVITNLIEFLETKEQLKKKFISGMAYPATVCTVGIVVGLVFLIFIMPKLESMLKSLGGDLPQMTKYLIDASKVAGQYWWAILLSILGIIGVTLAYRNTPKGRYNLDHWVLRIPIVGMIIKENFYCQTSNLLATLLGSGINTTEAMELAKNASANRYFRQRFIEAKEAVMNGASMTQAFETYGVMPDLALDLLSMGENTGDLAGSLKSVYKKYHGDLINDLNMMSSAVTAIAMGCAFVGVAILALSVITSVLQVTSSIKM